MRWQLDRKANIFQDNMTITESKIVAQKAAARLWQFLPKRALLAVSILFALPVCGVLTAFGVASDTQLDKIERHELIEQLSLPAFEPLANSNERFSASERIQRGDTVAALLQRLKVDDPAAFAFLRTEPKAKAIFQLRPNRSLQATTNADGRLLALTYLYSAEEYLRVERQADDAGFSAEMKPIAPAALLTRKSGVIRSSLYGATDDAGIPDAVATQIARIFSTDIDFHVDLRKGDRFSVVYEMLHQDGESLGAGRVVSAEFTNNGKTFEAFLYTDPDGQDGYYSVDGQNRAKSFLRSPLAFSRVSSGFGGRVHPLLKNWRQHTGVDFAAPRGTPIWATADGVVDFAGVKGGYGNVIEVRHHAGTTTLYGHLSAFAAGARKGMRVSQGQTIGYVGATGWATGPHLHYEFKIAGAHQDPLRVALPKAEPLAQKYIAAFKQSAQAQSAQLALLRDSSFGKFE
ncbi:MAG: M23 family metallopeptidase [Usitatibacteraceae bacterium]